MKTVVLVKQVPDVSQMEFDPKTRTLRREGVRLEVSSFDVRALLRAVELRGECGGEVVAMTMGPPQAREALIHCLALGADRAVHLVDRAFAGSDTLATARALALAIRREGFDLVLCGKVSVDAETGQVGPEVAELLDCVQVTSVRSLTVDPRRRRLRAERETEGGFETIECALPALLTAAEDLARERFPKKAEKEAAASKPIDEVTARDLSEDASLFGFAGSPTSVEAIEHVEETRQGRVLEGDPAAAVPELMRVLRKRDLLGSVAGPAPRAVPSRRSRRPDPGRQIWVVAETFGDELRRVTFELLGKAHELAAGSDSEVVAFLIGHDVRRHERALAGAADRILVADDPVLADYSTDAWAAIVARAIEARKPRSVLVPSTYLGRDLAPRVAARLRLGLTGDCIDLTLDGEGHLLQWKPAFGGNFVAPIRSRTLPEMATVRPGMLEPIVPGGEATAIVEEIHPTDLPAIRTLVVDRRPEPGVARAEALDSAAIAIGVGRGIGGAGALAKIEELAAALGGAAIAATRDVTDDGWLPKQHQVGLTGRAIAPRLYLAIGIRGAFEHMVGLRRAGLIVAINKNAKAPIFAHSDLGVVGDWAEIVSRLIEEVRTPPGEH
ncbi:MAG: FAD-binding protein [Candidatus Binatia bacterium]